MRQLIRLLVLVATSFFVTVTTQAQTPYSKDLKANPKWVRSELQKMGLSKKFITEAMKIYQTEQFERVLRLNLLGFMKPPQHMNLVTPEAVSEASKFLKQNRKDFELAQNKYQVSPDVIASLLWIETRHGDNLGDFHILSVFLNLMQADTPENRKTLTQMALWQNRDGKEFQDKELKKLMKERASRKAKWARDEVRALASIFQKNQLDLKSLKGSYAGAFGMTQFLPSSYRDFAKAAHPKTAPNLMKSSDAIMSVAHYLSKHGWKAKKSSSRIKSLMGYNNSRDYAESILEISRRVQAGEPGSRIRSSSTVKDRS